MTDYTTQELEEALRAITSTIHKCEKAQEKLQGNSRCASQLTLLKNRIKAFTIASALITEALER